VQRDAHNKRIYIIRTRERKAFGEARLFRHFVIETIEKKGGEGHIWEIEKVNNRYGFSTRGSRPTATAHWTLLCLEGRKEIGEKEADIPKKGEVTESEFIGL